MMRMTKELRAIFMKIEQDHLETELNAFFEDAAEIRASSYGPSALADWPGDSCHHFKYITKEEGDAIDEWLGQVAFYRSRRYTSDDVMGTLYPDEY